MTGPCDAAALGPFRLLTFSGGLPDLVAGRENPAALGDMDDLLPQPNSLRRAGEETKAAVLAASDLMRAEGLIASDRVGVYVGQQQVSLDYCARFVDASYREGPRFASPMLFSESVANNVATHLSLTLGFKGIAQTFIGTRAAGIQAVIAAAEDLQAGAIDAGVAVVLGVATQLTAQAYTAVFSPGARRRAPGGMSFLRGAAAFLVRPPAPGRTRILYAGVRCAGRSAEEQAGMLEGLWNDCNGRLPGGTRWTASTFILARDRSGEILRRAGAAIPPGPALAEGFALDPFVRLLLDGVQFNGDSPRGVVCLGEEGTAGILAVEGPPRESGT